MKEKVLQIGPLAIDGKTHGGMVSYLESFLRSGIADHYHLKIIDTHIPDIYKKFRLLRIFLSMKYLALLFINLILFRPCIVHIHMSSGKGRLGFWEKWLFGYLSKKSGKKVIFHLHGADFDKFLLEKKNEYFISRALKIANKNIILSQNWYKAFRNFIPEEKLIHIPNAINTSLFKQKTDTTIKSKVVNILFVGSVGRRKGLFELGKSIRLLTEHGFKDFIVHIVGEEEHKGELLEIQKFYKEMQIEKHSLFHGAIFGEAKIEFFKNADIFVLPSWHESFGLVNLEAMAAGLPIVSTKVGAIPEYIVHGENGFLIDPGDAEQLEHYLKILIMDDEIRIKMGQKNLIKVQEQFDWKVIASEIVQLYDSLLN